MPDEPYAAGVQGLVGQNEPRLLLRGQAIFDQRQIQVFIAAVQFVADDRMAEVGEVDTDLVFAAGEGNYSQKRKRKIEDGGGTSFFSSSSFVLGF